MRLLTTPTDQCLVKLPGIPHGAKCPLSAVIVWIPLEYLRGSGPYEDRLKFPFPSLLFLEIRVPRRGGFEMLEWLRNNPDCSVIPVIILTASKLQSDIKRAYQ